MSHTSQITDRTGRSKFPVPTNQRLSPEALFRLSSFGTGGIQGYRPSDEGFANNLRGNIFFNGKPPTEQVNLTFIWLGKGSVKFSDVPNSLRSMGLRPATLRECLSLGREVRLSESREALSEVYNKYFVNSPTILYVLGSRDLITIKDDELFFQADLESVEARKSELLTRKYYWILATEL